MINKVSFSLMSVDEQINYCEEVGNTLSPLSEVAPAVTPLADKFVADTKEARDVNHKKRGSEYTELVDNSESARDEALIAYRTYLEACSHRSVDIKRLAANKLLEIYRSHGWSFHIRGAKAESNRINSMNDEVTTIAENAAALQTIDATEWWNDVITKDKEYHTNLMLRQQQMGSIPDAVSASAYAKMRSSYHQLVQVIEAISIMTPDPKIDEWMKTVNQFADSYMMVARSRKTRLETIKNEAKEKAKSQQ